MPRIVKLLEATEKFVKLLVLDVLYSRLFTVLRCSLRQHGH